MTTEEIEILFADTIAKKSFKKDSGLDKFKVYNYRNKPVSFALKLDLLYSMDLIKVSKK